MVQPADARQSDDLGVSTRTSLFRSQRGCRLPPAQVGAIVVVVRDVILLRFAWELAASDGKIVVAGIDIGELASDGKLQRIAGCFGPLPASPM